MFRELVANMTGIIEEFGLSNLSRVETKLEQPSLFDALEGEAA